MAADTVDRTHPSMTADWRFVRLLRGMRAEQDGTRVHWTAGFDDCGVSEGRYMVVTTDFGNNVGSIGSDEM